MATKMQKLLAEQRLGDIQAVKDSVEVLSTAVQEAKWGYVEFLATQIQQKARQLQGYVQAAPHA